MNVPVTDIIIEVFRAAPKAEWQNLFEEMRQQEFSRIRSQPEEQLTHIQQRVKLLDELEIFILQASQVAPSAKPNRSK